VPPMDLFGAQLMAKVWLNSHFDQRAWFVALLVHAGLSSECLKFL
jgi:hypothetical protein